MSSKSSKSGSDNYKMERSSTTTTDSGFWTTIDLLMEREWKNKKGEMAEDNHESSTDLKTLLKGSGKSFKNKVRLTTGNKFSQIATKLKLVEDTQQDDIIPGLKSSLWNTPRNAMASLKGKGERYVDKETLRRLQQTSRKENMEAQQHRIKSREMEEKDRLKKQILNGRSSNLDDCPPDMRSNPVYVFWHLVNKEMEKMNRARADAYYRKYRKSRRGTRRSSNREAVCIEEDSIVSRSEETPEPNVPPVIENIRETPSVPNISFNVPDNIRFKYEDEGIRELRNLMTVQELYQMADKIIGTPSREIVQDDSSTR